MLKMAGELIEGQLAEHAATVDAHIHTPFTVMRAGNFFNPLYRAETEGFGYAAIAADTLYATPFPVPRKSTWDRIALRVYVAGGTGAKCRLGIYKDNGQCYPGSLVLDAGEVACETTGHKDIAISQPLEKGLYWLVFTGNDASVSIARTSYYQSNIGMNYLITVMRGAYHASQAYGALPASFPESASTWEFLWMTALRLASLD